MAAKADKNLTPEQQRQVRAENQKYAEQRTKWYKEANSFLSGQETMPVYNLPQVDVTAQAKANPVFLNKNPNKPNSSKEGAEMNPDNTRVKNE